MNDTLYIIGNGFDLHHGLKTSFINFRDNFAKKKWRFWAALKKIYGVKMDDNMWWYKFEEMLGSVDYQNLTTANNSPILSTSMLQNVLQNWIPSYIECWINQIDDNVPKDESITINTDAQFFTFNYTNVLEKTYGIDKNSIWHIHNSLTNKGEDNKLIVGHDFDERQLFLLSNEYNDGHTIERPDIVDDFNRKIAGGAKHVQERITQNKNKFALYSNIRHYVSMGFSFNNIDMPYIKEIVSVNNSIHDADWNSYFHSDEEKTKFFNIISELGIKPNMITSTKW